MHNAFMAIRHGVPGHDNGTAILRAQLARMIDGHVGDGYTGQYEIICPACGDDPNLTITRCPATSRSFADRVSRWPASWQRSSCKSGSWTTRQQPGH